MTVPVTQPRVRAAIVSRWPVLRGALEDAVGACDGVEVAETTDSAAGLAGGDAASIDAIVVDAGVLADEKVGAAELGERLDADVIVLADANDEYASADAAYLTGAAAVVSLQRGSAAVCRALAALRRPDG